MGRAKRKFPKGAFFLRVERNAEVNVEYPVYVRYIWDRRIIKKDTGFSSRIRDWNPDAYNGQGAFRPSYGGCYVRCNNLLRDILANIDNTIKEYTMKYPEKGLDYDVIHSIVFGEPLTRSDGGRDFIEYVKEHLKREYIRNRIKFSRYENGLSCMNVFREFIKARQKGTYREDSIYLADISGQLIDEYIEYRKHIKNNTNVTINHALTPIIKACEEASLRHYISSDVYAEIRKKRLIADSFSIDCEYFDGRYLSMGQLRELVAFYESDTERRRKEYIEMFLFAFHAGGLRMVDIMTLQWRHIDFEKRELRKVLVKRAKSQKQRHMVPLTEPAMRILRKWQKSGRRQKYVFDLFQDSVDATIEEILYYRRNSIDKKVNQALKAVGREICLPFELTFHVARHTFAINALNHPTHPLDMYQVSRLLGHSSTNTTEKVYADYLIERLTDEMNSLDFNFVPDKM